MKKTSSLLTLLLFSALPSLGLAQDNGQTTRLTILHTTDLHDHLRPGYIGIGGLPYKSGYIQQVRAERDDVILLDAGDFLEKGDYFAYVSEGRVTVEALARMNYDGITIGNHDHDAGMDLLREFEEILGQEFILLNLVNEDGSTQFQRSRVVEKKGLRIGLIGMIAPRRPEYGGLDLDASGEALALESRRLRDEEECHIVIVVAHHASRACGHWSKQAPDVDIFIAAHDHREIFTPVVVEETGALIVQAGYDGHWVGKLEVYIDNSTGEIVDHTGKLVLMCHEMIPVDGEMLEWLLAEEDRLAPYAAEFVADIQQPWGWFALSRLGAEAVRVQSGADIVFIHPTQIMRNSLPAGPVDFNAIFRLGSYRIDPLLKMDLSGEEIAAYLNALGEKTSWGLVQWAGVKIYPERTSDRNSAVTADLEAENVYSVVMTEREFDRYFIRIMERFRNGEYSGLTPRESYEAEPVDFKFAQVFAKYIRQLKAGGGSLSEEMERLRKAQGGVDPNEALIEPRFLRMVDAEAFRSRAAPQQ